MSLHFLLISISYLRHFKGSIFEHNWQFSEDFKWVNADEEFSMCMNIINWIMRFHWSWLDVGCLDDILLVAILDNLQKNWRRVGTKTKTIEELLCSPSLVGGHQSASLLNLRQTTAANFWYFKWLNVSEEVSMCLLKEVSVIIVRRVLFRQSVSFCYNWKPQCKKKETNSE